MSVTRVLGGRKFAAFFASSTALVALYVFGFELSQATLDAIVAMFLAFAAGNGVEHVAAQLGRRVEQPSAESLPKDVAEAIRDAFEAGDK